MFINRFIKNLDYIVSKFWFVFCCIILVGALLVKALYSFADMPYFEWNVSYDIVFVCLMLTTYVFLFKWRERVEKIPYPVLWMIFGALGVAFVFLVPIIPFSDMKHVTEGALLFSDKDINGIFASEYLQYIAKNLKVSLFYGITSCLLPTSIFSLRIINVVLYLLIAHFLGLVGKNLRLDYPKLIFVITASFLPLLLYCNHVYFDLPVLCMCMIAVYFYTKEKTLKNMILTGVFLGAACTLRVLAYLFLIAITMDYVFVYKSDLFKKKGKALLFLIIFVVITCFVPKITDNVVNSTLRTGSVEEGTRKDENIWGLFGVGINEEEFGFMNQNLPYKVRSFSDFCEVLGSRDIESHIKLFGRKIFWTWSQGTYQAQRYAFGNKIESQTGQFLYETPITPYVEDDNQVVRQVLNSLMRAQYIALFALMILGMCKMDEKDREKYRMLIYLMFGTFLILIFYEMKSRYVMHCMSPMIILAIRGLINIKEKKLLNTKQKE